MKVQLINFFSVNEAVKLNENFRNYYRTFTRYFLLNSQYTTPSKTEIKKRLFQKKALHLILRRNVELRIIDNFHLKLAELYDEQFLQSRYYTTTFIHVNSIYKFQ